MCTFTYAYGVTLVAVVSARHHATLTDEFESALQGSQNVERINGLIYAVVMDSRAVYTAPDQETVERYGNGLMRYNEQILKLVQAARRELSSRLKGEE